MQIAISAFGLFTMIFLAWVMSSNRKQVSWRIVFGGLGLQFLFALFILRTTPGRALFDWIGKLFNTLADHVEVGSAFLFGINPLPSDDPMPPMNALLRSFAFGVLPTIIFFSALMSIFYHLGIMQRVVDVIARVMQKTLGTSGAESLSAASNIFVGQTEAPLVIKPYLKGMTLSELNAVMIGGFATIAGGVMAAYVQMGVDAGHLATACVISAPAALMIAKIIVPETETPETLGSVENKFHSDSVNVLEAAAAGTSDGLKLALNVGAMLIAFLALLAMVNDVLGWTGDRFYDLAGYLFQTTRGTTWSMEYFLGYAFWPFAWVMGIPSDDCLRAGELLGIRLVANEFLAYDRLGRWMQESGDGAPDPRTALILTYALSGFANFSSIGIQLGGISSIAPGRRSDLAKLSFRAMIGGMLTTFMTACIAGILEPNPAQMEPMLEQTSSAEIKTPGQQFVDLDSADLSRHRIDEIDRQFLSKLRDELPASATGSMYTFGSDSHGHETTSAQRHRFANGNAFGTDCQAIGGVFHIAAGVDFSLLVADRGTNEEPGIGSIGVASCLDRRLYQLFCSEPGTHQSPHIFNGNTIGNQSKLRRFILDDDECLSYLRRYRRRFAWSSMHQRNRLVLINPFTCFDKQFDTRRVIDYVIHQPTAATNFNHGVPQTIAINVG